MKKIIKTLLLCSLSLVMITGCESMGQVTVDNEKVNKILNMSQEEAEEKIANYTEKAKSELKEQIKKELAKQDGSAEPGILSGVEDIALTDMTGAGTDYVFIYDGNPYVAKYTPDNWEITDSYRITNAMDMAVICQALINVHPVHGRDMVSYRTASDMAYEWSQHNVVYQLLPEDSRWMDSVKDVDFDPEDQGKSYEELYEDRTGRKLDLKEMLRKIMQ
ncbi:MAG: hypothetical protein IJP84_04700 [Lachnospiraceae bacterium]|nr:hypothetical protein [Lachnospiraceae bacterium]